MPKIDDPASGPRLCETNWVWLAERTEGVACELGDEDEPGDPRLQELFFDVKRKQALPGLAIALGDETVDAVVVHGIRNNEAAVLDENFLCECRRVLRPGGYVVFCADNAWWYQRILARPSMRRFREAPGVPLRCGVQSAERRLKRAGFQNVRCYFEDGSSTGLGSLMPASGGSQYEMGMNHGPLTARRLIRLLLIRLGVGFLLYRTLLVFGYR